MRKRTQEILKQTASVDSPKSRFGDTSHFRKFVAFTEAAPIPRPLLGSLVRGLKSEAGDEGSTNLVA